MPAEHVLFYFFVLFSQILFKLGTHTSVYFRRIFYVYLIENQIHHHQVEYTLTSQHHKTPKHHIISDQIIMPNAATKRKQVNGKSDQEGKSRRGRFPHGTAAAELSVVPLVVTPDAASRTRVSTPSSLEPSPRKLSSQLMSQS